jgi:hypothetical protein
MGNDTIDPAVRESLDKMHAAFKLTVEAARLAKKAFADAYPGGWQWVEPPEGLDDHPAIAALVDFEEAADALRNLLERGVPKRPSTSPARPPA